MANISQNQNTTEKLTINLFIYLFFYFKVKEHIHNGSALSPPPPTAWTQPGPSYCSAPQCFYTMALLKTYKALFFKINLSQIFNQCLMGRGMQPCQPASLRAGRANIPKWSATWEKGYLDKYDLLIRLSYSLTGLRSGLLLLLLLLLSCCRLTGLCEARGRGELSLKMLPN